MLAELKHAIGKINDVNPPVGQSDGASRTKAAVVDAKRSLMVVEANVELQDIFRERLKNSGYRVLVTRDPERALARFAENAKTADCVVFCTGDLGESALAAFNQFGEQPATKDIPAVLLLGKNHQSWKSKAKLAKHRVLMSMPIKVGQLRETLDKLMPQDAAH
jgi:serine/threonine-protein kinase